MQDKTKKSSGLAVRAFKTTAVLFLLFTPVALLAFYLGQASIIDEGLDYYEPNFSKVVATAEQRQSMPCSTTIYVPAYSHIYWEDGEGALLSVTLSVRSMSSDKPLIVESVNYYGTDGEILGEKLKEPVMLKPLQSFTFLVKRSDLTGGVGANFLVEIAGAESESPPIHAEAIMIGKTSAGTISFSRTGIHASTTCK